MAGSSLTAASGPDPSTGLRAVVVLRELADRLEEQHVERAVQLGWSWTRIAEALNVTRQAAHKKHAERLRSLGLTLGKGRDA